ncbi:2375_t:CDS:2 [Paraglomus occultum]|uniref:2375_t:CDS:1 n=1 Tax=Paraglomus occultum TaxID=144539 RepID=A0A9N8Z0Z0_9GLOM|nr:2375_t:CDS:2 [Paraglomus occultum]
MTRTKHSPKQNRHYQRSPFGDLRGPPKKEGAGQHNWGNVTAETAELDEHYELLDDCPKYDLEKVEKIVEVEGQLRDTKINVVDPNEFEKLRAATAEEQE